MCTTPTTTPNMNTITDLMSATNYWIMLAAQTRTYGHTYVHASRRGFAGQIAHQHGDVAFTYQSYGRSLQSGGHKFKVHAWNVITKKPVSSAALREMRVK